MEAKHEGKAADHKTDASSATGTHELVGRNCRCVRRAFGIVVVDRVCFLLLTMILLMDSLGAIPIESHHDERLTLSEHPVIPRQRERARRPLDAIPLLRGLTNENETATMNQHSLFQKNLGRTIDSSDMTPDCVHRGGGLPVPPEHKVRLPRTGFTFLSPTTKVYATANHDQEERNMIARVESESSWSLTGLCKEYGPLVWKTYWGVYFGTLGGLFVGVQSGVLNPLRVLSGTNTQTVSEYAAGFLQRHARVARYAPFVQSHPMAANFLVAFAIAEASEPIRIAATAILVPSIARRRKYENMSEQQVTNSQVVSSYRRPKHM
jgi:hypothetical protein